VVVGLVVATVALTLPSERSHEIPAQGPEDAVTLTYRLHTGDPTEAARILRDRLSAAGITAVVTAGDHSLAITAPESARADVTALTAPGRFAIYDWERSVLGPDGRPAPTDPAVTGGPNAGQEPALTEGEAHSRASETRGARALQAERGWVALAGRPAVTNTDLASARAGEDPAGGGPNVTLELTPPGQQAFTTLTRALAQRGADQPGTGDPLQTAQHLALVLDDRLVATPYVNWREAPDGIDGADGVPMSGLRTPEQARLTAALLSAGPLPHALELVRG